MAKYAYRRRVHCDPKSPLLRQFLTTWRTKGASRRFPSRTELRPRDFPRLLPFATLARRVPESRDFEFRVIGEAVIEAYGENFTGRRLSEIEFAVCSIMREAYGAVAHSGEPVLLEGWFERFNRDAFSREVLMVPLGQRDSAVDHILSAGVYEANNPCRFLSLEAID